MYNAKRASANALFAIKYRKSVSFFIIYSHTYKQHMSVPNEAGLLRRARNLEHEAVVEIYDLYSSSIFAYAFRILGDPILAEDCVSETFLRLLRSLQNRGGPKENLKAYLYRIAHNWITDHYKKKSSHEVELTDSLFRDGENQVENQVDRNLDLDSARSAVMDLSSDQRFVITLRYGEGWDIDQIAHAMGRPVGAVKALQYRALSTLQKRLGAGKVSDETGE